MHYRELGSTGLHVSEVGLGCNRLGEAHAPTTHWVDLVKRAVDLGVTVFDTSESYGWGRSEEVLGHALGNRDDVLVATKASRVRQTGANDFSTERIVKRVEESLRRLQRDIIDIYQLHSPSRAALERLEWAEAMDTLKDQGKIRFAGVAVNSEADALWLMERDLVEVLQITYSILHTVPENGLFQMTTDKGVGLLCRMPLARGVLTGKFEPDQKVPAGHRALLDGDQVYDNIRRAEALRPVAEAYEGGMTRLALHYSLTPQAVSAVIPGARNEVQLEENVAASNGTGLPKDVWAEIQCLIVRR